MFLGKREKWWSEGSFVSMAVYRADTVIGEREREGFSVAWTTSILFPLPSSSSITILPFSPIHSNPTFLFFIINLLNMANM